MNIVALSVDAELKSLLSRCDLPIDDLGVSTQQCFFGIRQNEQLVGCVGIECYADVGLLRSLAVHPEYRQRSFGLRLLKHAEIEAQSSGISTLYLLTSTAASYFLGHGYNLTDRQEAPQTIKATAQFAGLCPSSATFMSKQLKQAQQGV